MARGRKPRNWVKMDCQGLLRGSINYLLELDGQAVWMKMVAMSEVCSGRPGYIEDGNQSGLPHKYIAQELHCSVELFEKVVEVMAKDKAVTITEEGSIFLVNFQNYQFTEYDRQRKYRVAKQDKDNGQETDDNVFKFFEDNFELLKAHNSEVLKDLEKEYGADKLKAAMKIAVEAGAHNLRYVEGVLKGKGKKDRKLDKNYTKPEDL